MWPVCIQNQTHSIVIHTSAKQQLQLSWRHLFYSLVDPPKTNLLAVSTIEAINQTVRCKENTIILKYVHCKHLFTFTKEYRAGANSHSWFVYLNK